MALIIQKFGGTSVANLERIHHVAQTVKAEVQKGNQVIVVVSAMAGTTNQLVTWAKEASPAYDRAEYDAIISSGELVTAGLLALALQEIGLKSRSFSGWQVPILTDGNHGVAAITDIPTENLLGCLKQGITPVVAGFQGVTPSGRVSTIGRGGSDLTAVALAAFFKADRCDIYTDVDGVYTADPRLVEKAQRRDSVSYEEMLELASQGAKVLQEQAVKFAQAHHVNLGVRSSLIDHGGTMITKTTPAARSHVTSINCLHTLAKIFLPSTTENIPQGCMNHIILDQKGQCLGYEFTWPESDLGHLSAQLNCAPSVTTNMSKISILVKKDWRDVSQKLFDYLKNSDIPVAMTQTTLSSLSVLIPRQWAEKVVKELHSIYGLDC